MAIIRNRKNETVRTIAVLIIGALLLLCGMAIIRNAYTTYTDYQASQHWPQVNTVIQNLDIIQNEDETFSINVSYNYKFQEKDYENKLEHYFEYDEELAHQEHQKLQTLFKQKTGWKVFINPQSPQANFDEIVFPDFIALLLLVASVFILFGLGLTFIALKLLFEIKKETKLQASYPNEPWKWSSQWNKGLVHSDRRNSIPVYITALIFWFQLTSFFIYAGYSEPLEINISLGIAGLMILAGLVFIFLVIKSQLKLLQHGQSVLEPLTFPGYSGSKFKAVINVPFQLNPEDDILFHIDCVKHYSTHDLRGKSESRTNLLWKETFSVPKKELLTENDVTVIPFSIQIPPDLPEASDNGISWSLRASAKIAGLNWSESFPLPIFHGQQSSAPKIT